MTANLYDFMTNMVQSIENIQKRLANINTS